jgi:hypothetical protein
MKATAAISIAALVAALAVTPSMALDLNVGLGANAGANVSSDDDSAGAGLGLGVNLNANADSDDDGDDTSVSAGANVSGGASVAGDDDLGVDTAVTGAIGASASDDNLDINARLDALLQLINDSDYEDTTLSAWVDASSTTVINTDDLFDLDGQAKIDAAVSANVEEQDDLSAAISANANLKAWLDANNIDTDSVIAIDVNADGSVEVYEG